MGRYWYNECKYQVTAKSFPNFNDKGNNRTIMTAMYKAPNAAAHAAFMSMSANTPAFTALPILGPIGSFMAFNNGCKIIHAKGKRNNAANKKFPFVNAK